MADMISNFSDDILLYILSFLPTKQVVATSVLSKRWYLLWRSVTSFDFDDFPTDYNIDHDKGKEAYTNFLHSVDSFLLRRDRDQPLHRFRLSCVSHCYYDPTFPHTESIQRWIQIALSESARVQHLDLDMSCCMQSLVFNCKTLVVLKLTNIGVEDISFVDLPVLKILHLDFVISFKRVDLMQLLSVSPNLEVLEAKSTFLFPEEKFDGCPKLVRANVHGDIVSLEIVKNVEVLFISLRRQKDLLFDFHNLLQLQLDYMSFHINWDDVLKMLNHCPKLQTLAIGCEKVRIGSRHQKYEGSIWPYPKSVPACISTHLKTCHLKNFRGSKDELRFARFIAENAKYLRNMKICSDNDNFDRETLNIVRYLSSCMKSSACTLSFEY